MIYADKYGYKISKLTLGTAAIGMKYGISNSPKEPVPGESLELLRLARSLGINSLDTARTYGRAEELVGQFLADEKDGQLHVTTKFKISPENLDNEAKAKEEAYASLQTSRKLLGLHCIPVCLFHMDSRLPIDKVIKTLPKIFEDLKADGWIRLSGISIDHPDELDLFIDYPFVQAVQIPINMFDMRLVRNGMLERLKQYDKLVFARSVFLQGLFFMDPAALKNNLKKAAPFIVELKKLATAANRSIAELAFTYVRDMKEITSIVFGAVNEMQIRQNIDLLHGEPLETAIRERIHHLFVEVPEEVITPRQWEL